MDSERFDCLTRALAASPSRRGVTRVFVGLALGGAAALEMTAPVAAKKCGPCKKKKRGKCRKKKPDNAACNGAGRCLNGKCNQPPTCAGAFDSCLTDNDCCSGNCIGPNPFSQCVRSAEGKPCFDDGDCTSDVCAGFVCQ